MSQSIPPDPLTRLEAMMAALSVEVAKGNDRLTEVIVQQRSQKDMAASHQSLLLNFNQRLSTVENELKAVQAKAERTARQQDESEGGVMAEMGHLAAKVAAVAADTRKHLGAQDEKLEKLAANDERQNALLGGIVEFTADVKTWKRAGALLVLAAPGAWEFIQWLMRHQ